MEKDLRKRSTLFQDGLAVQSRWQSISSDLPGPEVGETSLFLVLLSVLSSMVVTLWFFSVSLQQ